MPSVNLEVASCCRRLAATGEAHHEPGAARLGAAVEDDELAASTAARRHERWQPRLVKDQLWKVRACCSMRWPYTTRLLSRSHFRLSVSRAQHS